MRLPLAIPPLLALAVSLGPGAESARADEATLTQARQCAAEASRLERLHCYDALFRSASASGHGQALPELWHEVMAQESTRAAEDVGIMASASADEVLLSVPALGTVPPRPVLVIGCREAITHFQLHLPEATDASRVDLRLLADGRPLPQQWRIRDGGRVVNGGRGLPAIDTLRQLLDTEELALASDLATLDGLRFRLDGLRQQIQPLRDACRW